MSVEFVLRSRGFWLSDVAFEVVPLSRRRMERLLAPRNPLSGKLGAIR
jgi:hypothetical protein